MWLALLGRFWKPLAYIFAAAATISAFYFLGYKAGEADERAIWVPALIVAEKARAAADARTDALTAASNALTAEYEARHAETLQTLNTRTVDADRRIRSLLRERAQHFRCESVPAVPGAAAVPDDATEIDARAERAGGRIAGVGRSCEADATDLAQLQQWVRDQRAILNR